MSLQIHGQIRESDAIAENKRSFLGQALKHHSSAQAAIKVLQEQLKYLDSLRKSTRERSILKEEKDLEQSTNELLSSTHRFLIDSPGNRRNISPLSSTINTLNEKNKTYNNLPKTISPIRNSNLSNLRVKSNSTPETSPLPSATVSYSIEEMSPFKSTRNSINHLDSSSLGGANLTEILGRLVYGDVTNVSEKSTNTSDELISVLEKISCAGEVLQHELQEAKSRESTLLKQIQNLRSKINGGSPQLQVSFGDGDVEMKCRKLEDAMLSLQEENLKLNRLFKENSSHVPVHYKDELSETKRNLASNQSENKLLRATIDRMKAQLAYYEERHNKKHSTEDSRESDIASSKAEGVMDDVVEKLKKKIERLEKELRLTRSEDKKGFETKLSEMHEKLLTKDNYIRKCEKELETIGERNKELQKKYDELHHSDVYKRKEVLQLCDKFEQMKVKYLKLENEVLSLQKKEKQESVNYRSAEDFLKKFLVDNETLHKQLESEQRDLAHSRDMLERDYDMLKGRYDDLLSHLSGLETSASVGRKKQVDFLTPVQADNSSASRGMVASQFSDVPPADSKSLKTTKKLVSEKHQNNILHRRHYTIPGCTHASFSKLRKAPSTCLRTKSASDVRSSISTLLPASCANHVATSADSFLAHAHNILTVPNCSTGSVVKLSHDAEKDIAILSDRAVYRRTPIMKNVKSKGMNYDWSSEALFRSHSSCDRLLVEGKEKLPLRSKSEVLIGSTPSPHRRRCDPDILCLDAASRLNGETPYASEYLSNMDGVRLAVSLGNSAQKVVESRSSRIGQSALLNTESIKTSTLKSKRSSPQRSDTSINDSFPPKTNSLLDITYDPSLTVSTSALPSLLTSVRYTESASSSKTSSSSTSEKSLHLSDLPCDETPVVDKFRNFDDYRGPPPVINGGQVSKPGLSQPALPSRDQDKENARRGDEIHARKDKVKKRSNLMKQLVESRLSAKEKQIKTSNEDYDAVDQSSVSTTRDHLGRIEFLRNIQINSGMHLRGLMSDTSVTEAVRLNDSDLNGEVRLGLSNNQEAYADKLVRKYTKSAGKILDLV